MSSVSKLKDKARDFERKEDWGKAVDAYLQVIKATEKGDSEAELSLYNRVGDLYLRLGRPSDAVDYYSKAADHYGEAGLYNNAIALCNKALRYQPDRLELYRKLGKLSAEQGFITDARRWYLEYAERLAKQGKTQDAFDALKEFAGLSEDPEIREMLAAQLEHRGEVAEAVTQLRLAWTQYVQQSASAKVKELQDRIVELDPSLEGTDLSLTTDGGNDEGDDEGDDLPGMYIDSGARSSAAPAAQTPPGPDRSVEFEQDHGPGDGGTGADALPTLDEPSETAASSDEVEPGDLPGLMSTDMGLETTPEVLAADLPTLDIDQGASLLDEEQDEDDAADAGFELPTLGDTADYGSDEDAAPLAGLEEFGESDMLEAGKEEADDAAFGDLPMLEGELSLGDEDEEGEDEEGEDEEGEDAGPLPTFDYELADEEDEDAGPLPTFDYELADEEDEAPLSAAWDEPLAEVDVEAEPEPVELEPGPEPEPAVAAEPEPEPEPEAEDTQTLGEIGAALDEVMVDSPSAGGDLEQFPEAPAAAAEPEDEPAEVPAPVPAEAPAAAPAGTDIDALIRSARERFEAGEEREAVASLDAQHANLADANQLMDAYRVAEALVRLDPDAVSAHQSRVEYAFRLDDRPRLVEAYLDFAACLRRTGSEAKSDSVYQRVLEIDPQNEKAHAVLRKPAAPAAAASAESEYIDLGGLMMDDEEQQTTRFVVAETVESGDEERDFAEMLSQFRAKVAQHVPQEDTDSHYDLGIAFKEMGLIDEAISEFQIALRGGNERLKVYEELGQCFMQKEQYNIAAKLLARGAQLPSSDEAELLGVYYLLGRCYEELGQTAEVREAYERVLGLDIDFRDVNERLSRL